MIHFILILNMIRITSYFDSLALLFVYEEEFI
jgi:hypothetical protein